MLRNTRISSVIGHAAAVGLVIGGLAGCAPPEPPQEPPPPPPPAPAAAKPASDVERRLGEYATVKLTADLSAYSDEQQQMIGLLIEASEIMDALFWRQAWGDRGALLGSLEDDAAIKLAEINYGPWDRLDGEHPFIDSVGEKPLGAEFYPADMTREEFNAWEQEGKDGLYSLVRRGDDGLELVPYSDEYAVELERASNLLEQAAGLADDPDFARYLTLRAQALVTDDYQPSDMAWLDMKNNPIDFVVGAIETYEDRLFGYRAAYEAYVLLKDMEWSERLARFAGFLPELQAGLPVDERYKQEVPGTDSDLNAYDVVYYAGHSNAGSKTIAINLPNDEEVQLAKGTRRLQLKNAMRAKFDRILVPIAGELIGPDQRDHITFDAFFGNTMFHEVAHGLGIKNTVNGSGSVRTALKELASPTEEGKADILGLYMITSLFEKGEIKDGELMDNYVTFLAGIFRSVRFGASSAHGRANMVRFNFFREAGAFTRDDKGHYRVNFDAMQAAITALSQTLLTLQGNGDYEGTTRLMVEMGMVTPALQADLDRLAAAGIPVDIVFEQGADVLGLRTL
ncbi:MAG: Zn-dependent hydrolase [Pseudomonadota bacterium]